MPKHVKNGKIWISIWSSHICDKKCIPLYPKGNSNKTRSNHCLLHTSKVSQTELLNIGLGRVEPMLLLKLLSMNDRLSDPKKFIHDTHKYGQWSTRRIMKRGMGNLRIIKMIS